MTKERKYILIFGCVLLMAGLVYRFFPSDLFQGESDLLFKQKKITKYNEVILQKSYVKKHLAKLRQIAENADRLLLRGSTPALAAVDIQNTLNQTAEKVGLTINRIEIGKAKLVDDVEEKNVTRIPVSFRVVSTTRQLRDMIYYIESSEKLIRIIEVNSNVIGTRQPEQINSKITVEGFIRE